MCDIIFKTLLTKPIYKIIDFIVFFYTRLDNRFFAVKRIPPNILTNGYFNYLTMKKPLTQIKVKKYYYLIIDSKPAFAINLLSLIKEKLTKV